MPRAATFVSFPSGPRDAAADWWNDPAQALQIERASQFARELLDVPVVPIEESPLSGAPLADLLSKVPHAAGAIIGGWVIAPDPTPLTLITMPSGVILFGAAVGVSKALETGLRAKILSWMGVADPVQPTAQTVETKRIDLGGAGTPPQSESPE